MVSRRPAAAFQKKHRSVVHKCISVRRVLCKPLEIVGSRVAASFSTSRYRSGPAQPSNPPPPPPSAVYRATEPLGISGCIAIPKVAEALEAHTKFHSNAEDLLPNEGFRFLLFLCYFFFWWRRAIHSAGNAAAGVTRGWSRLGKGGVWVVSSFRRENDESLKNCVDGNKYFS